MSVLHVHCDDAGEHAGSGRAGDEVCGAGPGESGKMLKELAIKAAQKKMKNVPVEVIARAVESAYQQMKAKDSL